MLSFGGDHEGAWPETDVGQLVMRPGGGAAVTPAGCGPTESSHQR